MPGRHEGGIQGTPTGAGLADVEVTEFPVPLRAASFDEWWTRTTALAGPLAKRLALLPDEAARDLTARVREAVRPFETPAGLEFPRGQPAGHRDQAAALVNGSSDWP